MKPQPPCPECEKLAAVSEESNKIGAFLDWMQSSKRIVPAKYEYDEEEDIEDLVVAWEYRGSNGINKLLAEYFQIDLDEVERERRALLDWLREVQGGSE